MKLLIEELQKFSKKNWWIYIILIICLFFIYITGKWSSLEVFFVFVFHFIGDLFIMMMTQSYKDKNYKIGAIYQIFWSAIFICIGLYGILKNGEGQYFLWNIPFLLSAIKSYFLYNLKKNLFFINAISMIILNIALLFIALKLELIFTLYSFIQVLGFSFFSIGLSIQKDIPRYFLSLFWIFLMPIWWIVGIYYNYFWWMIEGVTVSFTLLPLTVLFFYLTLLPKYLLELKK